MSEQEEDGYDCLLPFDSDDPEFVRGFEAGRLWEQMKALELGGELRQTIHSTNAEMAMRMGEQIGLTWTADAAESMPAEWVELVVSHETESGSTGTEDDGE